MSGESFGLALASGLASPAILNNNSNAGSVSAKDFEQFQIQLIQLKSDLYEAKDRESRTQLAMKKMAEDFQSLQNKYLTQDQQLQKVESARQKADKALAASKDAKKLTQFLQDHENYKANLKGEFEQQMEQNQALKQQLKDQYNKNKELLDELVSLKAELPYNNSSSSTSNGGSRGSDSGGGSGGSENSTRLDQIKGFQDEINRLKSELETITEVYREKELKEKENEKSMERIIARLSDKEIQLAELRDEANKANETIRTLSQQLQSAEVKAKLLANLNLESNSGPINSNPSSNNSSSGQQNSSSSSGSGDKEKLSKAKDAIENRVNKLANSAGKFASSLRETFSSPKTKSITEETNQSANNQQAPISSAAAAVNENSINSSVLSPTVDVTSDSSDSSSADRSASRLESELAQQQLLNEKLLESIQKKDAQIKKNHEDTERVLAKLTETELEIMKFREQSMQFDAAIKEAKAKDAKIKKLESNEALNEKSRQLQTELKVAYDSVQMMQAEFDLIKSQLEDAKDQLFIAETAAGDARRLVDSRDESIAELRSTLDANEKTIARLCDQVDSSELSFNAAVKEWEEKYNTEINQWEEKYKNETESLENNVRRLNDELSIVQETLAARDSLIDDLSIRLKKIEEIEFEQRNQLEIANEKLRILNAELNDKTTEAKIEAKKRNVIVEELKKQLKKESSRAKELEAQLRAMREEIDSIRQGNEPTNGESVMQLSIPSPMNSSNPVEAEVSNALAMKISLCQDENFTLKKKIARLEEESALMRSDVQQKKEIIRNLVGQIDTGKLGTEENRADKTVNSELFQQLNEDDRNKLFEKMEAVLQETSIQSMKLKDSLNILNEELLKSQTAIELMKQERFQFEDEIENLKNSLDEIRDEKLLSDQTALDSVQLVKNYQIQLDRMKKSLDEEKQRNHNELGSGRIELEKSTGELQAAREEITKLESIIESNHKEITERNQQIELLNEKFKQTENRINELQSQLSQMELQSIEANNKSSSQIAELQSELSQMEVQSIAANNKFINEIAELNSQLNTANLLVTESAKKLCSCENKLRESELREEYEKTRSNQLNSDIEIEKQKYIKLQEEINKSVAQKNTEIEIQESQQSPIQLSGIDIQTADLIDFSSSTKSIPPVSDSTDSSSVPSSSSAAAADAISSVSSMQQSDFLSDLMNNLQ